MKKANPTTSKSGRKSRALIRFLCHHLSQAPRHLGYIPKWF
ncbi:hypothetical protein HMPREF1423_01097 [Helicobacter pylori GAM270ASi]|nr:hypothetical protein HMPREF1423_01097 [Helicobacter pylori GAM270ASi]